MKNFKLFLGALFVILIFSSCEVDEAIPINNTPDLSSEDRFSENRGPTITFGRYYARCFGNQCVETFKLIDITLLEDTVDKYPASGTYYQGNFIDFKGSEKVKTSEILSNFPLELLDSKLITYGTPDAGDWGGIYLEYEDGNHHRYWFVDLYTKNIPKYLIEYVTLIDKKITEIGKINNLN